MFQSKLIKFCAPTLAGIKCGSLFKFKTQYTLYADELINKYNGLAYYARLFSYKKDL